VGKVGEARAFSRVHGEREGGITAMKSGVRDFRIQRIILVLLVILLAIATIMDFYLYFGMIKPLQESESAGEGGGFEIVVAPYGKMGVMWIFVSPRAYLSLGRSFNISVQGALWDPYAPSATYNVTIRVYQRALHETYLSSPSAEKDLTAEKHWHELTVPFWVNLTLTPPRAYGTYIYKVEFEIMSKIYEEYTTEFPIIVVR
jgi:hypothetical protein